MLGSLGLSEWLAIMIAIIAGILFIAMLKAQFKASNIQALFDVQLNQKKQENQNLIIEISQLKQELNQYQQQNVAQNIKISELKTRLEEIINAAHEKQTVLEQSEQRLTTQFEN